MAVAGILIGALAVGAIIGTVLGRAHADQQAAATTTTVTVPTVRSIAERSTDCADGINGAGRAVKALLDGAPAAATPEAADAARAAVRDARQRCADLLPECPAIADAYAGWLDQGVAQAVAAATDPTSTAALGDPPSLRCSVSG